VKDLTDTMLDAPGVGLAAPQIGVGLRVFTYYVDDELGHLINPSLERQDDRQQYEPLHRCLPGAAGSVSVTVVPFPTVESTSTRPSCICTMR